MQSNLPTWYHESKFYLDLTLGYHPPLSAQYNFCNLVLFWKFFTFGPLEERFLEMEPQHGTTVHGTVG